MSTPVHATSTHFKIRQNWHVTYPKAAIPLYQALSQRMRLGTFASTVASFLPARTDARVSHGRGSSEVVWGARFDAGGARVGRARAGVCVLVT